jgi:hypothetical protein
VGSSTLRAAWWKFLLAGPCLVALVILGAYARVDAWFVGVVVVLTGFVLSAIGLLLAGTLLLRRRSAPVPT